MRGPGTFFSQKKQKTNKINRVRKHFFENPKNEEAEEVGHMWGKLGGGMVDDLASYGLQVMQAYVCQTSALLPCVPCGRGIVPAGLPQISARRFKDAGEVPTC